MKGRFLLAAIITLAAAPAFASPFGVGLPEASPPGFLPWIAGLQSQFYRDLTAALKDLKESGQAFWWLGGVSFAYGVVHAAGPGHGKVVISSYLLANEERARRGVALAFVSAFVQALVAVAIVGVMAAALGFTSMQITQTAQALEVGSYALVAALGIYLLARKGKQIRHVLAHHHRHGHDHHHHEHGHACCHVPDPAKGGTAAAAVLSVGLRPCSGALIVLVFALAQGIFWAGVASTFLMALGTAITVAVLAALAVCAKGVAGRLAGRDSARAERVLLGLEILGALAITALGAVLLLGALA